VTAPLGPSERVELVEEESVAPGGAVTVTWLVRHNDGWVRARSHPDARSEPLERGSRVVWRTRVTLALPRGTALERVESRPAPNQRSALDYLTGSARGASRRTARRCYVVGPGGALLPRV
jgi:hypothetical protein